MKKLNRLFWIVCLFTISLNSCKNTPEPKTREVFIKEIKQMEQADWLYGSGKKEIMNFNLDSLNRHYNRFIDAFPQDQMVPRFVFKRGANFQTAEKYDSAIVEFNRLMKQFPSHNLSAEALFLEGQIYLEGLQQYGPATDCWELFIKKYPNDPRCEQIKLLMDNKGLSNKELLNEVTKHGLQTKGHN